MTAEKYVKLNAWIEDVCSGLDPIVSVVRAPKYECWHKLKRGLLYVLIRFPRREPATQTEQLAYIANKLNLEEAKQICVNMQEIGPPKVWKSAASFLSAKASMQQAVFLDLVQDAKNFLRQQESLE